MEYHEENIKDELQAYYGNEILINNHEKIDNKNTTTLGGHNISENNHILNIDFSQKNLDVDGIFDDILNTKTIKEMFLIEKELSLKIQECQIEMQKFIHSNYKKLQSISNILNTNTLIGDDNDSAFLNLNKVASDIENSKNLVNEKFQEIKNDIFTKENNESLEMHLSQYKLFEVMSELKRFHLILEDCFSKQNYQELIHLYNKWKNALKMLSNDDNFKMEFQSILANSNVVFEKTIKTLKKQILVNINKDSILPNLKSITKSYIALNNGGINFTNDLVLNINNLFQDIINEIVVRQLENVDIQAEDKMVTFLNTCKQSYQEIFILLNFVISELDRKEIDPVIPSSILKNLFEVSFIKVIELLGHLLNYEKNSPKSELNLKPILQGFEYLKQSIKELVKTLALANFAKNSYFSLENCKYLIVSSEHTSDHLDYFDDDYYNNTDCIIKKKHIEWKKSILNDFLKIENLDLNIKDVLNDLFDVVITLQNSDVEALFSEMSKNILNKLINDDLFNIIRGFKELINIDFEVCDNLVRKVIKDIFQTIVSNSIQNVNSIFFNSIINRDFDLNSIENFNQMIEKMHLELSFSLNGNNDLDLNHNQKSTLEKFSLVDYNQKATYFLSIIILIRYLREKSLPSCISLFYECFYSNNMHKVYTKSIAENVSLLDLFNSDQPKYQPSKGLNSNFDEDDATMQIIKTLFNRFEILFLNIFVIWNIYTIIQETYNYIDIKNSEKIRLDEFIDLVHSNTLKLFKFCNSLFQFQNSNYLRNSAIPEFQFPIKNVEKSLIFAKWSNNYYILKDFNLTNTKITKKPISFWFSQILHGILIEITFIIKNSNFIIADNTNAFEKSLSKFWNHIQHYFECNIDFNITHALFCQLYNTLISLNN